MESAQTVGDVSFGDVLNQKNLFGIGEDAAEGLLVFADNFFQIQVDGVQRSADDFHFALSQNIGSLHFLGSGAAKQQKCKEQRENGGGKFLKIHRT